MDGQKLITMRDGCAGFFSEAELAAGRGIVHTKLDLRPDPRQLPDDWVELAPAPTALESYDDEAAALNKSMDAVKGTMEELKNLDY